MAKKRVGSAFYPKKSAAKRLRETLCLRGKKTASPAFHTSEKISHKATKPQRNRKETS
ncbi:Uncharacterized protein dnm_065660 [Desulfonema magnum]|uniref:Uncharacterized protein n=1 Tax=Desulfonema magnum TaxID=45655 RepID=A0A975BSZ0_9BACT|nr:Uncharacterized protein dnm_065660 [Desulfonema magnum]